VGSESNRVAVVTGANAGIGFETALELCRAGASVVMGCRNPERALRAQRELLARVPSARAEILPLDVSEPASIRDFARAFSDRFGRLDLLVNNAGIVAIPLSRNSAGHELQLATHHLGPFALTGRLLPLFRADTGGRIVNVGSLAHRFARLPLDDLNWDETPYHEWKAYARSKLALLSFTVELERRLRRTGSRVVALAAHPGFAATEITRHTAALTPGNAVSRWFQDEVARRLIPLASEAARSVLFAARDERASGGDYCGPSGFLEIAGAPARARLNPLARDAALGRAIWELSEAMTGVRFLSEPQPSEGLGRAGSVKTPPMPE
jgi:NAD(P)-dependent dehydrogenase (short-subunit alcohol dehydrogenase family)